MITLIEDIVYEEIVTDVGLTPCCLNVLEIDNKNLSELIYNFSLSIEIRIKALENYYKNKREETIEIINKIAGIYHFSGSKILESFLFAICDKECNISVCLKLESAKSIHFFNNDNENGYIALECVCKQMIDLPTPCKIEAICMLMKSDMFKNKCKEYFCFLINDYNIECNFRYKTILSLEKQSIKNKDYYLKESCISFLDRETNAITHRILSSQYLLQKCNLDLYIKELVENILLLFANDVNLQYNERADASDTLLRFGSDENKIRARNVIILLGIDGQNIVKTVFNNAQNVHTEEIEESVIEILDMLHKKYTLSITETDSSILTFEYIEKQINDIIKFGSCNFNLLLDSDKILLINLSLNRINLDRALYSKYNCSLSSILIKVYFYISSSIDKDILMERLLEELIEMSGTCSTGFASRLINTISGFENISIRISFEDQISSNIFGRLNAKIRDIEDEDIKFKILEEMTVSSLKDKKTFYTFFISVIPSIKEEMYQEFRSYMSDTDFDMYMIKAISLYQYGEKFV